MGKLLNNQLFQVENDKKTLFCRGAKTNEIINHAMMDLYDMKKPLTTKMDK